MCYNYGPERTLERWQWRGTPHSPKLQHCCNPTIGLFSVINRTLVAGRSNPSAEKQSVYSTSPSQLGKPTTIVSRRKNIDSRIKSWSSHRIGLKMSSAVPITILRDHYQLHILNFYMYPQPQQTRIKHVRNWHLYLRRRDLILRFIMYLFFSG